MVTDQLITMPDSIRWSNAPLGMPQGYQQVMVVGNPRLAELFTFRASISPNWRAMPHFHPSDEHITVLEGSCFIGRGERYDEATAVMMPTGAFVMFKTGAVHYFFTKTGCVIQVHGMGPQRITYIDPDDDPRNGVRPVLLDAPEH